ncbi:MAG: hypothetical protein RLY31_1619 [Bacteroidota bacterium]
MNQAPFLQFLQHEKRYSRHTLTAYRGDLGQFAGYLLEQYGLSDERQVTHQHIRSWMVRLLEDGKGARTIGRKLSCLKRYFRFLCQTGVRETDPMAKVRTPRAGRRLPVFLRERQTSSLFDLVAEDTGWKGLRDRVLLELLYGTGMRRGELVGLRCGDLALSEARLKVLGKGGKERLIPLADHLVELLREYLRCRAAQFPDVVSEMLLLTDKGAPANGDFVYRKVRRYLSLVSSAEQRSPHVLRHSFATHLTDHGAALNAVRELLGHASLAATQVYTHNTAARLREVYKQAHPKAALPDAGDPENPAPEERNRNK